MIEISRLTLLVAGELLLGLTLLSGFLLGRLIVRKGRIRKAARLLVERIQTDKESRAQRLRIRLAEQYQYEGEKLEEGVKVLTQAEMRLYQNIINSYLKQDVEEFQQTDVDVENLVLAYQGLDVPSHDADLPDEIVENANDTVEIERLKDENERLSEELRVTMDTMGRMLNEYSSMFAGGAENQLDKTQLRGIFEKNEPTSEEEVEDATKEIELDDKSVSHMLETDIEDLVEPLSQLDESVLDTPDIAQDEMQEHLHKAEMDTDIEHSEASEVLPPSIEDSLVDDLTQVDIEIADADEIGDDEPPEPGSLEEEWAKLLEEDAESAESIAEETGPDVKERQGMV